jgi:glycosyltransferase involved in cell wall biosynthesis
MRVCLVYDRLYPHSIGGAERWLRDLAVRLAEAGHQVTYVTTRQWEKENEPQLPGVNIIGVTGTRRSHVEGRRAVGPPLLFGAAVLRHLVRHRHRYDVVHTASFPYFPLLAAALARSRRPYLLVVDWHEVWTRGYWRLYAGPLIGTIGWLVQRVCVRVAHRAFCVSRMHARRLLAEGFRGEVTVLPGLYAGPVGSTPAEAVDSGTVVYAGRHVREKRVPALVRGFAAALRQRPQLRLELYGDGPERDDVERLVVELGLSGCVQVHGQRDEAEVEHAVASAACVATASEREGYGLIVVEAAARGTPSVVVSGPENAATELVAEGVNGAIAPSAAPEELGEAILRALDGGAALRASTARWFTENAATLRIENSVSAVLETYATR